MTEPLITVIIPTYNNGATLGVAIESILDQTYRNLEIIIVDDSSTDETKQVASHYAKKDARIQLLECEVDQNRFDVKLNRNINAGWSARNKGLGVARGEYITFQDGDDASLLNRIEIQMNLLQKYDAAHITTEYASFKTELLGTFATSPLPEPSMGPNEIYRLSQKSKGLFLKFFPKLNRCIPFHFKRKPILHKLFFGTLEPYPGAGNNPFFDRKVIEHVQFRQLDRRVWPSFMGRGADRDFNFQVAETFKNSYYFNIPLYLWRQ